MEKAEHHGIDVARRSRHRQRPGKQVLQLVERLTRALRMYGRIFHEEPCSLTIEIGMFDAELKGLRFRNPEKRAQERSFSRILAPLGENTMNSLRWAIVASLVSCASAEGGMQDEPKVASYTLTNAG